MNIRMLTSLILLMTISKGGLGLEQENTPSLFLKREGNGEFSPGSAS